MSAPQVLWAIEMDAPAEGSSFSSNPKPIEGSIEQTVLDETGREVRGRHGVAPYAIDANSMGWLVAGASRIAAPHFVEAIRTLPPTSSGSVRAWVAALFSHSPYRARDFALQQQIPLFDSELDTLLARSNIRCVYVCNHPRHHGQTVLSALRAGKHVLCEPPLALNLEEAHYLHNAAANRGLILAVNYQHRQDPSLEVLRTMIAEDDLGTILGGYIRNCVLLPPELHTWRVEPAWGGILFDRTLRTVDLLRFLLQAEFASVLAQSGPRMFSSNSTSGGEHGLAPIEDAHAIATMKGSGATFHLHDSYLLPHAPSRVDLFGASGSVTIMPWSETEASSMSVYRHGERLQVYTPKANNWQRAIMAFDASVRSGQLSVAGSVDDIENLSVCIALRDAISQGIAVQPVQQGIFFK